MYFSITSTSTQKNRIERVGGGSGDGGGGWVTAHDETLGLFLESAFACNSAVVAMKETLYSVFFS